MEVPILGVFSCNAVGVAASCRFEAVGGLLFWCEQRWDGLFERGFLGMDWVLGLGFGACAFCEFIEGTWG